MKEILKLNKYDKWVAIYPHVGYLSFHINDEVMDLLKALGISSLVTKYFASYLDFFESLDKLQDTSKHVLLYNSIWFYYMNYSFTFIKSQLAYDFGIDLKKALDKVSRQERDGRLPKIFSSVHSDLKEQKDLFEKEMPEFKIPVYDDNLTKTVKKLFNFSHMIDFYNLYMDLFDFNKKAYEEELIYIEEFNEPDFKHEFYDLLELLIRDKSLLNNGVDAQLNYGLLGNRRFKIKRVERLILSK